jgi:uncharacterized RDD family membrane protein YckC
MVEPLAASRLAAASVSNGYAALADRAGLTSRILAYLLDSLILFAFTMLFAALSGLAMFLRTNGGEQAITDADQWLSIAIYLAAMPAWLVANLALNQARGQTAGQFVIGLRVLQEDGSRAGRSRLLVYWLALHPLFFHPLFGISWIVLAWAALLSEAAFVLSLAVAILCFAAPVAGLAFALSDSQRRAIHDRLAGIKVVRLA